jgi:hypothetical protein
MRYRKKPVEIEAIQLTPEVCWDYWKNKNLVFGKFSVSGNYNPYTNEIYRAYIQIDTLEGVMTAELNDYIIQDVKGEFYPCKPDIFELTYERV